MKCLIGIFAGLTLN